MKIAANTHRSLTRTQALRNHQIPLPSPSADPCLSSLASLAGSLSLSSVASPPSSLRSPPLISGQSLHSRKLKEAAPSSPTTSSFSLSSSPPSAQQSRNIHAFLSAVPKFTRTAKELSKKGLTKVMKRDFSAGQSAYDTPEVCELANVVADVASILSEVRGSLNESEAFSSALSSAAQSFGQFIELGRGGACL